MARQEETLDEYADRLFGGEDELLAKMRQEAEREGIPMIHVPHDLARLLATLIAGSGAVRVLEIGTLFGLSAITMARAIPEDGELVTLEVDPKHAAIARKNIERAEVSDRVEVIEGPALESLERLGRTEQDFDFVFIDADKVSYPAYLDWALELSHLGTVIVADNVWRHGDVLNPRDDGDRGMATFNEKLAAERSLISTIVPTREGEDAASVSVITA